MDAGRCGTAATAPTGASMTAPAYRYAATAVSVHDGDTFTARIDLGFRVVIELELRIADVNAPELRQAGGPEARDFLRDSLAGRGLIVTTRKTRTGRDDVSFARYVADVLIIEAAGHEIDVADLLVTAGHALPVR